MTSSKFLRSIRGDRPFERVQDIRMGWTMRLLTCALLLITVGLAPVGLYAECPPNAICGVRGSDERPKVPSDGAPPPWNIDEKDELIPAPTNMPTNPDLPVPDAETDPIEVVPAEQSSEEERAMRALDARLHDCARLLLEIGGDAKSERPVQPSKIDWCIDALSNRPGHVAMRRLEAASRQPCRTFSRQARRYGSLPSDPRLKGDGGQLPPLVEELRRGIRYCANASTVERSELPRFVLSNGRFRDVSAGDRIRNPGDDYLRHARKQSIIKETTDEALKLIEAYRAEGRLMDAAADAYRQRARICERRSEEMLRSVFLPQPYVDMPAANGCIVSVLREVKETPPLEESTPIWMWGIIGVMALLLGAMGYQGMVRWGAETDFPGDGDHSS